MTNSEQWKAVPGYEAIYEVSDLGRVKSLSRPAICRGGIRIIRERILKFNFGAQGGYPCVGLYKDGVSRTWFIHQLVMLAFVGPVPDGMEVRHFNGDECDPKLSNLLYGTRKQNRDDGQRLGEIPRGAARWNAKLTESAVAALRLAAQSGESRAAIAQRLGINKMTVGKIIRRETWAHVP